MLHYPTVCKGFFFHLLHQQLFDTKMDNNYMKMYEKVFNIFSDQRNFRENNIEGHMCTPTILALWKFKVGVLQI